MPPLTFRLLLQTRDDLAAQLQNALAHHAQCGCAVHATVVRFLAAELWILARQLELIEAFELAPAPAH